MDIRRASDGYNEEFKFYSENTALHNYVLRDVSLEKLSDCDLRMDSAECAVRGILSAETKDLPLRNVLAGSIINYDQLKKYIQEFRYDHKLDNGKNLLPTFINKMVRLHTNIKGNPEIYIYDVDEKFKVDSKNIRLVVNKDLSCSLFVNNKEKPAMLNYVLSQFSTDAPYANYVMTNAVGKAGLPIESDKWCYLAKRKSCEIYSCSNTVEHKLLSVLGNNQDALRSLGTKKQTKHRIIKNRILAELVLFAGISCFVVAASYLCMLGLFSKQIFAYFPNNADWVISLISAGICLPLAIAGMFCLFKSCNYRDDYCLIKHLSTELEMANYSQVFEEVVLSESQPLSK